MMDFNKKFILLFCFTSSIHLNLLQCLSPRIEDEFNVDKSLKYSKNDKRNSRLQFSAFQKHFDLPLEEMSEIFADNFELFYTSDEPLTGKITLQESRIKAKDHRGTFYSIKDGIGGIYLEENDDGIRVEGIIDEDIRILPQEKGIKSNAFSHKAIKISKPNPTDDSFLNDYVSANANNIPYNITHWQGNHTAYLEVLVVFDFNNSAALNFDSEAIRKYLGIFWNSIQNRYSIFNDPYIRLVLTGAIIIRDIKHEPFIRQHMIKEYEVDGSKMLEDFGKWLYEYQNNLAVFDIAFLQSGLDLSLSSKEGYINNLLGLAYIGTVCKVDKSKRMMWNCGEGEDIAPLYTGIRTIAHEIGHLLSSFHDGEYTSKSCQISDGYIMGYPNYDNPRNAYYFSQCSVRSIKQYLRQRSPCVWNKPKRRIKLIQQLPGSNMTMNDVCSKWFGVGSSAYGDIKRNEVCTVLWCQTPTGKIKTHGPPPEGSICEKQLICKRGRCTRHHKISYI